ncbi:MAG: MMPL family transporter [Ilumatobacteraceae bacterium]
MLFAGGTVLVSLLGMLLMRVGFLNGFAYATSTAVLLAIATALTLIPALLGLAGDRIDRFALHRRHAATAAERHTFAGRWSAWIQRHARLAAGLGAAVLLAAAAPVAWMRLATADAGNDPSGTTTRTAYDRLADGFGAGFNGPLLVVVDDARVANDVAAAVAATDGIVAVAPPAPVGALAVIAAVPSSSPQSVETQRLVHTLRDDTLPSVVGGSGVRAHVGGSTASDIDFAQVMGDRLPWFIGGVLVLSFVLLLVVFRSLLVPLKAVLLNLLSIAAAYGAMVMVFQWGWLGGLIGVEHGAPIEPWAPMMLFAIVFGLSMDYEVFLLSGIQERYHRTGDNSAAVVGGLAATARVITAAAAIMVCVFGSFVLADVRALKLMGLGLSAAVALDATVVRMVLVPATMELLGDRNWWLPSRMSRLLPRWSVEG